MKIAIARPSGTHPRALGRLILNEPGVEVAWVANDDTSVVRHIRAVRPDLLLLDFDLARDAVELAKGLMLECPCPILMLAEALERHAGRIGDAIDAGAIDAIEAPQVDAHGFVGGTGIPLLEHIRAIAQAGAATPPVGPKASSLLVMGASAGGPRALAKVLSVLPSDFSAAVLIVQHVEPQFSGELTTWLQARCLLPVRTARQGDDLLPGIVLVAGGPDHLVLTARGKLAHLAALTGCLHHPSIDVLFESIAKNWTGRLAGVLLTGMGSDGASGLKALRNNKALTIAQDQQSSAVYGMPKAAARCGAAVDILCLDTIGPRLLGFFRAPQGSQNCRQGLAGARKS